MALFGAGQLGGLEQSSAPIVALGGRGGGGGGGRGGGGHGGGHVGGARGAHGMQGRPGVSRFQQHGFNGQNRFGHNWNRNNWNRQWWHNTNRYGWPYRFNNYGYGIGGGDDGYYPLDYGYGYDYSNGYNPPDYYPPQYYPPEYSLPQYYPQDYPPSVNPPNVNPQPTQSYGLPQSTPNTNTNVTPPKKEGPVVIPPSLQYLSVPPAKQTPPGQGAEMKRAQPVAPGPSTVGEESALPEGMEIAITPGESGADVLSIINPDDTKTSVEIDESDRTSTIAIPVSGGGAVEIHLGEQDSPPKAAPSGSSGGHWTWIAPASNSKGFWVWVDEN